MHKDVSDQKLSATPEFLEVAYKMLNRKYFNGKLPTGIAFRVRVQTRESYVGKASYIYDIYEGKLHTKAVTLNGANTLSLHEWLEVVLHEMIHVLDYETNPNHFMVGSVGMYYKRKYYDPHGSWFMEQGRKFEKEGFHVQRYCNADSGINTDDSRVQSRISNSVFLYLVDGENRQYILKMSRKNLDKHIEFISQKIGRGAFAKGASEIIVMSSKNPNIAKLSDMRMKDSTSRASWWWFTPEFKKNYGPFEEEDCVQLWFGKNGKRLAAEGDDEPEEVEPESVEEVADEIQDNIKSVVDVEGITPNEVEVAIA